MCCFFYTRSPSSRHSSSTCASSILDYPAPNSQYRRAGSTYVVHHRPSSSPRYGSTPPTRRTDRHCLVRRRPRRRLRYVQFRSNYLLLRITLRVGRHVLGVRDSWFRFKLSRSLGFYPQEAMLTPDIIVIARTLIRIVKPERLRYDDYWIYLAYLILCINAVLQTVQTPYIYHLVRVRARLEPTSEAFLKDGNAYLRYEFAIIGLFWSVLWSVSAHLGVNAPQLNPPFRAARHISPAFGGFQHLNLSHNLGALPQRSHADFEMCR